MKRAGESCCDGADSSMDAALRVQLGQRYERYWSSWSGTVEGFVMREHADDADTALVRSDDGSGLIRWKVWEGHLCGTKSKGERLCKSLGPGHRIDATLKLVSLNLRPPARPLN